MDIVPRTQHKLNFSENIPVKLLVRMLQLSRRELGQPAQQTDQAEARRRVAAAAMTHDTAHSPRCYDRRLSRLTWPEQSQWQSADSTDYLWATTNFISKVWKIVGNLEFKSARFSLGDWSQEAVDVMLFNSELKGGEHWDNADERWNAWTFVARR